MSNSDVKRIATPQAPAAVGPYSQGTVAGDFLFVSGQLPMEPESGILVSGAIEDKAHRMIKNVKAVIEAAGGDLRQVVKATVFFKDLAHFQQVNAVYAEYFGDTMPARAAVQVAALPKDADLEMEAIVYLAKS